MTAALTHGLRVAMYTDAASERFDVQWSDDPLVTLRLLPSTPLSVEPCTE